MALFASFLCIWIQKHFDRQLFFYCSYLISQIRNTLSIIILFDCEQLIPYNNCMGVIPRNEDFEDKRFCFRWRENNPFVMDVAYVRFYCFYLIRVQF